MDKKANQERIYLADNIRKLRKLKGWPQEKLAFESNTTSHCFIDLESASRNIITDTLSRIAHTLDVTVHDITKPN